MNHSPSPWSVDRSASGELGIWDANESHVTHSESDLPLETRITNVAVMVSAPEMVALIYELTERHDIPRAIANAAQTILQRIHAVERDFSSI